MPMKTAGIDSCSRQARGNDEALASGQLDHTRDTSKEEADEEPDTKMQKVE